MDGEVENLSTSTDDLFAGWNERSWKDDEKSDSTEEYHRKMKRNSMEFSPPIDLMNNKKLKLGDEEPKVSQLVDLSTQLTLSPSTSKIRNQWKFPSPNGDEKLRSCELETWENVITSESSPEDSQTNRSTLSDTEVNNFRSGRRGLRRRPARKAKTPVLSDSESEMPNLRIKKSPRCQIFPRHSCRQASTSSISAQNSSIRDRSKSTTHSIEGPSTSRDYNYRPNTPNLPSTSRLENDVSVILLSDDDNVGSPNPVNIVQQVEDDERYAQFLQAQFDAEMIPHHEHSTRPPSIQPHNSSHFNRAHGGRGMNVHFNNVSFNTDPWTATTTAMFTGNNFFSWNGNTNDALLGNNQRARTSRRNNRHWNFWSEDDYETLLGLIDELGDVSKGLNRAEIGQLPTRKVSEVPRATGPAGKTSQCQICMCDYEIGEEIRCLTCFHEFHTNCIDRWLEGNATCPICRLEVKLTQEGSV